jgi:hypothetical protein
MRQTLVALIVSLAVAGCGSDKKSASKTDTPASTPTGASTPVATPALAGAQTVQGTGYAYKIPTAFKNGAAALKGSAIKFDSVYINAVTKVLPKENIVVIRETPPGIKPSDIGQVETTFRGQAKTLADSNGVFPTKDIQLDGETAKTYGYVMRQGGGIGRQRQEFAIHDGAVYTITWTGPAKSFKRSEQLFDQVLASWHWG